MRGVITLGGFVPPRSPHHSMAWGTIVLGVIVGITALIVLIALVVWIRYSVKYRIGK
jgi:hypothetical protein